MITRTRVLAGLTTLALAAGGAAVAAAVPAGAAPTTPAAAITGDPNAANGSIAFYDASGNRITSGTDLSRVFDFAAASSAGRTGTTKATVYFAFPDHTKANSTTWFQKQVTASTNYPVSSPAPVAALTTPVATADAGQADLAAVLPTTTLDTTDGYAGIVQVRLRDSGPGQQVQTSPFWATDIYFDQAAGTWQQVFPAAPTSTTTSLTATPTGVVAPGSTVTLTATVTPSGTAGSVQFADNGADVGAPVAVSGDTATTTVTPTAGTHDYTATFTPTSADFTTSSGSTQVVAANVPAAPGGTTATAGNAKATVSWTAPTDNGGAAITTYVVQYRKTGTTTWTTAPGSGTATSRLVSGLTNGASYQFQVAAQNAAGVGAFGAIASATPVADGTTLYTTAPTAVRYSATGTVSTQLVDTTTKKAVPSATVSLYRRASSTAASSLVANRTTDANGRASVAVRFTANGQYYWRFAGTATLKAAVSASRSVTVSQVISATRTASSIKHGSTVKVYGTVSPTGSGQTISLQRLVGKTWKTVSTVTIKTQTLPNRTKVAGFVFSQKLTTKGTYTFRVYKPSTSTLAYGVTGSLPVKAV